MTGQTGRGRTASLRYRLAFSYAGIALLSVAVLGAVLVGVLDNYYRSAEDAYLQAVAARAAQQINELGSATPDLSRELLILALSAQTRARIYDSGGALVADSGSPGDIDPRTLAPRGRGRGELHDRELPSPLGGGIFGAAPGAARSDRVFTSQLTDGAGTLIGTLELSEGPASGRDVLASVAQALAIAAVVAVILAAVAGYLLSSRISQPIVSLTETSDAMAEGNLGARAQVDRADEVGRLASSFNTMADRIEATVTTLRRFVADAAHEIGTPLTALQADLELAEDAPTPEDRAVFVQRALAQARRIEGLSSNLLRLSRLEAGEETGAEERVDLGVLVRTTADGAASRAEQAGLEFTTALPSESVVVLGSSAKLQVMIDNLLDNAFKFTAEHGSVELGLSAEGRSALLWVSDSGIGIPEAEQPEVFSRFYRARNVAAYSGSGLGLAIVLATAEAHGGTVGFRSSGEGTRFEVRLPLA